MNGDVNAGSKSVFAGEMEAYGGEVVLCHLKDIVGIGEEDVAAFEIGGHVLVFAFFECLEFGCVV